MKNFFGEQESTLERIKNLQMGYVIINESEKTIHYLPLYHAIAVWTKKENAIQYIKENSPDKEFGMVMSYTMSYLYLACIKAGFDNLVFDLKRNRVNDGDEIIIYSITALDNYYLKMEVCN